jgi:uncharacterized delta-60 repeat protein
VLQRWQGFRLAAWTSGITAMFTLVPASSAHALPEALDPTFGGDGIVTTRIGDTGDTEVAFAMARQLDGKLVVAGIWEDDFAVARYHADGSLDTDSDSDPGSHFSDDGKIVTPMSADETITARADEARAVVIQPDGKIVVAGFANALPQSDGLSGDFALARYNPDGTLDNGFDGDGKVITSMGTSDGAAYALARQSDGKLVAAGRSESGSSSDFALARYNTDGSLDTSSDSTPASAFDGDGKASADVSSTSNADQAAAIAIQSDGKIVTAGLANPTGGSFQEDFALARFNSDGTLDNGFDADGKVTTSISTSSNPSDEAHALVIQADGKLVAAGEANMNPDNFALVRYNDNGTLDTTFDGDGKVTTSLSPVGNTSVAHGLALQGDGKLVAAGRAANFGQVPNSNVFTFHNDFALARYNTNGSLDTTFDADGRVTTEIAPTPQSDVARAVLVDPDGKAVAAGHADMGPPEFLDVDFAIVRHLPNGDNVPPGAPTVTATDPASPSNDETPRVKGTTDAGSTVALYGNDSCSGSPRGQGPAAVFNSAGVEATALPNQETRFYATATDGSGNTSGCSATFASYVHDGVPPSPPTLTGTDPPSPADNPSPRVKGSAEAGSTVKIFRACNPFATSIAQGSAAELASPGIQVSAFEGTSNGFSATATDAAGNTSACSATLNYVELNPQPSSGPPAGGSTPSPFPGTGTSTGPGGAGSAEDDDGDPPRIAAPSGSAGAATANARGVFTVPRTTVRCAEDGGVCDVIASAATARAVSVKLAPAHHAVLTLGRAAFTVEAGESSRVRIRLPRRARSVLRRLRRVRAVAAITVTNLRETTATRTVRFTLRAPRR